EKPCFSKAGDIWRLGKHTVICGDSTDPETFRLLLRDTKVNLVCTDAPYFVKLESQSGRIANDDLEDAQAYELLMKACTNFKDAMDIDASIYALYATMEARVVYDAFEDAGFQVGARLIWKKPSAPLMRTDWKFNMEPIIFGWRKDGKHKWYGDQKQKAVFEFDGIKNSKEDGHGHPSDRKSTRLNSSHVSISYAVFCLKKKRKNNNIITLLLKLICNRSNRSHERQHVKFCTTKH